MMPSILIIFFLTLPLFHGCNNIPKNGAILGNEISVGIFRMQEEHEKIIHALADIELEVLEKNWNHLYGYIEKKYQTENGLLVDNALVKEDRQRIAEFSGTMKADIIKEIAAAEAELMLQVRKNTDQVITINNEVQNYLLSVNNLAESKQSIAQSYQKISAIDFSKLRGIVNNRLEKLQESNRNDTPIIE